MGFFDRKARARFGLGAPALMCMCVLVLAGCVQDPAAGSQPSDKDGKSDEGGSPEPLPSVDDLPKVDGDGESSFVSHVAYETTADSPDALAADSEASAGKAAAPAARSAERAIAEADIIQVQGDLLFALSVYSGMTIVDMSDPQDLAVAGQYRTGARPFEMYLRDNRAYVMFNGYWSYVHDERAGATQWRSSARLQALDVSDPADIKLLADSELPGDVSDSRLVGEMLYLVTYENGWCWGCEENRPVTRVASFDISDPSEFSKVDELSFEGDENSSGARSIHVNQARMYVAGPTWGETGGSTIQVVDIADPAGSLGLGTEVEVAGRIDSRWQMNEYNGVLRVISQDGGWRSDTPPIVETFRIESTAELSALAQLTMRLPRPEDLQSVRFDGERAYAITFEQTDPLFTLDMSDPAAPKQTGELEIPGFVYHMEPRGDRVYGLGFDRANDDGGMHVSIFDVSDMTNPTMLDRVNFGAQWARAAEDQDRIHKAFNLMLDEGLILVPYSGGEYDEETCRYAQQSGIQIIDIEGDDLTLRGSAPQLGRARRSLMHGGALYGISDDAVQSFDIADRDAPKALDRLEVARNVTSVHLLGDRVMRFGNDWWTDRTLIDFTSRSAVNSAQPSGELDLSELLADEPAECNQRAHFTEQVLVHQGETAYLARRVDRWRDDSGLWTQQSEMTIYVVDLTGDDPEIVNTIEMDGAEDTEWLGSMVLTRSALLVGRGKDRHARWDDDDSTRPRFYYDIYSLQSPTAPAFVERFEMPTEVASRGWGSGVIGCGMDMGWGFWYGYDNTPNAIASGDLLVSQREEPLDDGTGRVRYFMERLDVSDPDNPHMLASVNIPGKAVHFDAEHALIVTLEDVLRTVEVTDYQDCRWRGSRVQVDWEALNENGQAECRIYDRYLNTLQLRSDDTAVRVSRLNLDDERISSRVAVSGERVFVTTVERIEVGRDAVTQHPQLEAFGVGTDRALRTLGSVGLPARQGYGFWATLSARGPRAFVEDSNQLHILDTSDPTAMDLATHDMPGWSCRSLQVNRNRAYCAMGKQGVLTFDL